MTTMICYCFNHTEEEIHDETLRCEGESAILNKILAAKRDGSCQCASRHPEGR